MHHHLGVVVAVGVRRLGQLEVPVETTLTAFSIARQMGVRTILNPAPARPLPDELLRLTDVCVPNEGELAILVGKPLTDAQSIKDAARRLLSRGPKAVVVTRGSKGWLWVEGKESHLGAVEHVRAVDTSGAGE